MAVASEGNTPLRLLVHIHIDFAKSPSMVVTIKDGPGIATPVGVVSRGVLPLVAESTLAELPLWA